MSDDPIDGEFGVDYQFYVLHSMLEQLPDPIKAHCVDQLDKTLKAVKNREDMIKNMVIGSLSDLRLEIRAMSFDLECTKRENEELIKFIKELRDYNG